MTAKPILLLLLAPLVFCQDQTLTSATLWAGTAVERNALTLQAYSQARIALDRALKNKKWTAAPEQQGRSLRSLPPAIILDVDETILDNSPFEAQQILDGGVFEPAKWNAWAQSATAAALPGAREFTNYAHSKGVTVYYVTNREAILKAATRANLEKAGFPFDPNKDTVYCRGEKPDWGQDKTTRRAEIAAHYRILLLFGDDLGDFISGASSSLADRQRLVEPHAADWGTKWFVLPNAMYGSWENALYPPGTKDQDRPRIRMELLRHIADSR
jgi:5'-nucleotidase (lipoprotein e(P4) family)